MRYRLLFTATVTMCIAALAAEVTQADNCCSCRPKRQRTNLSDRLAQRKAAQRPWHGAYYDAAYGVPMALVVPPNVGRTVDWSWGVSGTRVTSIPHQFRRPYPGTYTEGFEGFRPTPPWLSDTNQFGVYYVRGPW